MNLTVCKIHQVFLELNKVNPPKKLPQGRILILLHNLSRPKPKLRDLRQTPLVPIVHTDIKGVPGGVPNNQRLGAKQLQDLNQL